MTLDPLFVDTSGWIGLLNRSDDLHAAASQWWAERPGGGEVVLTDWIIAETGNGLARTAARSAFAKSIVALRSSRNCRIVPVDQTLQTRAVMLYESHRDKTWGLVDCASFLVMRDLEIRIALTSDIHFEQAGFIKLL